MNIIRLPDSELEIMLIIWRLGDNVSTSEIMKNVERNQSIQLAQSYLKRLEEKKYVSVEKLGRLNFYTPLVKLEDYRNQETANFLDKFYKESRINLFASLIKDNKISEKEKATIRELIDKSE